MLGDPSNCRCACTAGSENMQPRSCVKEDNHFCFESNLNISYVTLSPSGQNDLKSFDYLKNSQCT